MLLSQFSKNLRNLLRKQRRRHRSQSEHRRRLDVEQLEARNLLATWTQLTNLPSAAIGTMMLLTDGRVMAQGENGTNGVANTWFQLVPNASGSYINGTWSSLTSMSLQRLYYGSNVLPSGKVFIVGGEYSGSTG